MALIGDGDGVFTFGDLAGQIVKIYRLAVSVGIVSGDGDANQIGYHGTNGNVTAGVVHRNAGYHIRGCFPGEAGDGKGSSLTRIGDCDGIAAFCNGAGEGVVGDSLGRAVGIVSRDGDTGKVRQRSSNGYIPAGVANGETVHGYNRLFRGHIASGIPGRKVQFCSQSINISGLMVLVNGMAENFHQQRRCSFAETGTGRTGLLQFGMEFVDGSHQGVLCVGFQIGKLSKLSLPAVGFLGQQLQIPVVFVNGGHQRALTFGIQL